MLLRRLGSTCQIINPFRPHTINVVLSYSTQNSKYPQETEYSNITDHIRGKIARRLLHQPDHPLKTIKNKIFNYFENDYQSKIPTNKDQFQFFDDLDPVVTVKENFIDLLTPEDHPTRQKDESYYLNENELLRCHMTAHQLPLLKTPNRSSLLFAGDVYRRDTVDSTHYPVSWIEKLKFISIFLTFL